MDFRIDRLQCAVCECSRATAGSTSLPHCLPSLSARWLAGSLARSRLRVSGVVSCHFISAADSHFLPPIDHVGRDGSVVRFLSSREA